MNFINLIGRPSFLGLGKEIGIEAPEAEGEEVKLE